MLCPEGFQGMVIMFCDYVLAAGQPDCTFVVSLKLIDWHPNSGFRCTSGGLTDGYLRAGAVIIL